MTDKPAPPKAPTDRGHADPPVGDPPAMRPKAPSIPPPLPGRIQPPAPKPGPLVVSPHPPAAKPMHSTVGTKNPAPSPAVSPNRPEPPRGRVSTLVGQGEGVTAKGAPIPAPTPPNGGRQAITRPPPFDPGRASVHDEIDEDLLATTEQRAVALEDLAVTTEHVSIDLASTGELLTTGEYVATPAAAPPPLRSAKPTLMGLKGETPAPAPVVAKPATPPPGKVSTATRPSSPSAIAKVNLVQKAVPVKKQLVPAVEESLPSNLLVTDSLPALPVASSELLPEVPSSPLLDVEVVEEIPAKAPPVKRATVQTLPPPSLPPPPVRPRAPSVPPPAMRAQTPTIPPTTLKPVATPQVPARSSAPPDVPIPRPSKSPRDLETWRPSQPMKRDGTSQMSTFAIVGAVLVAAGGAYVLGRQSSDNGAKPSVSAPASVAPPVSVTAVASVAASAEPAKVVSYSKCRKEGGAKAIATGVFAKVPAELLVEPSGDLAVAFADKARNAKVFGLGADLSVATTQASLATFDVKRAVPFLDADGKLAVAAEGADVSADFASRRRVQGAPIDFGIQKKALAVVTRGSSNFEAVPGTEGVGTDLEALRAHSSNGTLVGYAFRRRGAIWAGALTVTNSGKGPRTFQGLGEVVGAPSVAASDGKFAVAWADRVGEDDPWQVRLAFGDAETVGAPVAFARPAGGLGTGAFSPSLAALPGGRFLLAWTEEGEDGNHQVRGEVLDATGTALSPPVVLSEPSFNAGQPAAALGKDGKGGVAFFHATEGGTFDLVVSRVLCE